MSLPGVSDAVNNPPTKNAAAVLEEGNLPDPQLDPRLDKTAAGLNAPHIPGNFPGEGAPADEQTEEIPFPPLSSIPSRLWRWTKSTVPTFGDLFESGVRQLVSRTMPPHRQMRMYEASLSHPITATFLVCQFICCGVPILVFVAGTFIFLAVAILLWGLLSALLLAPILLVASATGVSIWGWGWVIYGFIRLTDKIFLNGMLTRLWLMQLEQYKEELEPSSENEQREKTPVSHENKRE
ncbi:hypothetical protein BJX96DRAFT_148490 [Aspergillus floccosus]